jgi:hypothetical protein
VGSMVGRLDPSYSASRGEMSGFGDKVQGCVW